MPRSKPKSRNLKTAPAAKSLGQVEVYFPPVRIPQPDGSLLIKPGKAVVLADGDEVTSREAAALIGCTLDWIGRMCDRGNLIEGRDWRRIGTRGNYRIQRSSILKLRKLAAASLLP